jgi:hypothetical protein
MFEECRTQALQSSDPKKIAGFIQAAIIYYPSGTKQSTGSHVDRMVERSCELAIDDMIARLRIVTGGDLGKDPQSWIDRYGEKEMVQSGRREGCPSRLPHHRTCGSAYGGSWQSLRTQQPLFLCHGDRCPDAQPVGFIAAGQDHRWSCSARQVQPFPSG